jgi:hypothetical protein
LVVVAQHDLETLLLLVAPGLTQFFLALHLLVVVGVALLIPTVIPAAQVEAQVVVSQGQELGVLHLHPVKVTLVETQLQTPYSTYFPLVVVALMVRAMQAQIRLLERVAMVLHPL